MPPLSAPPPPPPAAPPPPLLLMLLPVPPTSLITMPEKVFEEALARLTAAVEKLVWPPLAKAAAAWAEGGL